MAIAIAIILKKWYKKSFVKQLENVMAKQQTFIVHLEDAQGKMCNFERFSCKRLETVRRNMRLLWESDLYRICNKDVVVWKIYATPDGYHRELEPVSVVNLS